MTGDEATKKWEAEKATLMKELSALSSDEKKQLIKKATTYRSGTDSSSAVYMGSLATSRLSHALGGIYGNDDLDDLLGKASPNQIDKALNVCAPYIDMMMRNPTKPCPCCGQIVPDTGEKHKVSILWGQAPEAGQEAETYEFDTKAELDAFMKGIEAMAGWSDYDIVAEGHVHGQDAQLNEDPHEP